MTKIHTIGRAQIKMYGRDHRPAHFHVLLPNGDALVEIETLQVLRGTLPAAVRDEVLAWAAANRATLIAEWNRHNPTLAL